MHIAILHPSNDGSTSPFKDHDPECDPGRYLPDATCEHVRIAKATAVRQVIELAARSIDVAINLCDGAWDEDRAGIEVVQALERLEVPFTGAGGDFYDPSREAMKLACHAAGGLFPPYVLARRPEDVELALDTLRFPLIVKHPQGYSSVGLTRESKVVDAAGLRREVARTCAAYQAALIEEFIEGREFTVLVTEPRAGEVEPWALRPVEFTFPPGESFKHFQLKWCDFREMGTHLVTAPDLEARLREISAGTFAGLNGSGYGRCDLRMDAAGELYLLEINPNCSVFYPDGQFGSADFILAHDPAGHRGFLEHLLACAVRRRDRTRVCWVLRFSKKAGFGICAARAIRSGELIQRREERPQTLVSRRHIESAWSVARRGRLRQHAWPLTAGTHLLRNGAPGDWQPLQHSCDPNTWLAGLDLVARRDIAAGEPLTIEMATICGPELEPFPCDCGEPNCRRVIRNTDYLLPEIRVRYAAHVSEFVETFWRKGA